MTEVPDKGEHNRVRGGHDQLGAAGRQTQNHAGRQHKEQDGKEEGHDPVHL